MDSMNIQAAKEIHRLVYDATTRNIPNLGGTYGFQVSQAANPEGLLRATSSFVGHLQAGKSLKSNQIEALRAECLVAEATGLLGATDIEQINQLLDKIGDN